MAARIAPLSSPDQQRQARELAHKVMGEGDQDPDKWQLALYMVAALAQIHRLTAVADPMMARFATGSAGPHRYPSLIAVGLDYLWVGPSFNDFEPALIEACRKHLKTHNLPAQRGHALDYIRNRIREQNWGALEQRWSEAQMRSGRANGCEGGRVAAPVPQVLDESTVPPYGTPAWHEWMERRQGGAK